MKGYLKQFFVIFVAVIFLYSCKKDDNENPVPEKLAVTELLGKWTVVEIKRTVAGSTTTLMPEEGFITLDLTSDSKVKIINVEEGVWGESVFSYNVNDSILTLPSPGPGNLKVIDKGTNSYVFAQTVIENGSEVAYQYTLNAYQNNGLSEEILKDKWDVINTKIYTQDGGSIQYIINESGITRDLITLELKTDDSYRYVDLYNFMETSEGDFTIIDENNLVIDAGTEDELLMHIILTASDTSLYFVDRSTSDPVFNKYKISLSKSDISLTTLDLAGKWEITEGSVTYDRIYDPGAGGTDISYTIDYGSFPEDRSLMIFDDNNLTVLDAYMGINTEVMGYEILNGSTLYLIDNGLFSGHYFVHIDQYTGSTIKGTVIQYYQGSDYIMTRTTTMNLHKTQDPSFTLELNDLLGQWEVTNNTTEVVNYLWESQGTLPEVDEEPATGNSINFIDWSGTVTDTDIPMMIIEKDKLLIRVDGYFGEYEMVLHVSDYNSTNNTIQVMYSEPHENQTEMYDDQYLVTLDLTKQ